MIEAPEYPGSRTWQGHSGLRDGFASWAQAWGALTVEVDELVEVDEERVLMIGRQRARGGSGGVEVEAPIGGLYRLRDGRIVSLRFFLDPDQARAAAGASPA